MQNGGQKCSNYLFQKKMHKIVEDKGFSDEIEAMIALAKRHSLKHIAYDEIFNLESVLTGKILHTDFEKRTDKRFAILNHLNEVQQSKPFSEKEVEEKVLSTERRQVVFG
jgi:hypothetical protein